MEYSREEIIEIRISSIEKSIGLIANEIRKYMPFGMEDTNLIIEETEEGLLVKLNPEIKEGNILISYYEVDTLIESLIDFNQILDKDHLEEVVPDIILQEVESWLDRSKTNTLTIRV